MTRSRVTWGIAFLDMVVILVSRIADPSGDFSATVIFTIGISSFVAVGALLDGRVPGNVIGLLLLAAGTLMTLAMALVTYASLGALQTPAWPLTEAARIVGPTFFVYPFTIALIGVPLVFPDGHLASPRFRWVVGLAVANLIAWTLLSIFGNPQGAESNPGTVADGSLTVVDAIQTFFLITTVVCFGAGGVAVSLRFRHGDPVQRQQIKWLLAIVGLGAIATPVSFLGSGAGPELAYVITSMTILSLFAIPIVIGLAILRYRLYEIDRIISRTITWSVTTGLIVAVFAVIVIGLQGPLAEVTGGNTLAVAGSTLVAAALFQPLRRRVQRMADRRFNRARYDSEQTLATFGERVRAEVDLTALSGAVLATADEAVRPTAARLWLRGSNSEDLPLS